MGIDPTKMDTGIAQLRSTGAQQKQPNSTTDFARLLEDTYNPALSQENSSIKAAAMIHQAQLQMLTGLFTDEGADQDSPLLSALESGSPYSMLGQRRSQNIDKYRIQQSEPSLLPAAKGSGRGEIDQLISQVAERYNLSEDLIHSIVTAESAYNPQAVSPVGAQGLMQLMPATAEDLGVNDSFDPAENLNGGSRYLKQLLDKYAGDIDHALAAYNWGQGNVDRHGLGKMPEETRNYLAKIKGMLARG
jgi:soluble lytic murein transglycosylase-like protein